MSGRHPKANREITADACAAQLVETAPSVVRFIRAQMRTRMPEFTMAQFRAMAFLDRRRGCALHEIARHLGVTAPTASSLIDRLVRRRLVTRQANLANRRQVTLRLTRDGAARLEAAKGAARRQTAGRLAGLPPLTLKTISTGLDALAQAFAERRPPNPR